MSNKVIVYMDEASTLGKLKEPFFIVAAVITKNHKPLLNAVKRSVQDINSVRPQESKIMELHSSQLTYTEKQTFYKRVKNLEYEIMFLCAHKESIKSILFKKPDICFNYFVYLLLSDVLYKYNCVEIVIDTRNVKVTSEKSLEDYMYLKMFERGMYSKQISVTYGDSKKYRGVQFADVIANALYARFNHKKSYFYKFFKSKVTKEELFPQHYFTQSSNYDII